MKILTEKGSELVRGWGEDGPLGIAVNPINEKPHSAVGMNTAPLQRLHLRTVGAQPSHVGFRCAM